MDKIIAPGRILFAVAIIAFGVEHFVCAQTEGATLPVIPWIPANPILAYLIGTALVAAGLSIAANLKARRTAILLGIFFLVCEVVLQFPKVAAKPLDIGFRTTAFEILAIGGAALTLAGVLPVDESYPQRWENPLKKLTSSGRYLFAASSIVFGIDHFLLLRFIASLIPPWFPGGLFWANFTGTAFIAAGVCIAVKRIDRLAATLLGTMFLLWFLSLHLPRVASAPRSHNPDEWSSTFIALGMCGASWIIAQDSLRVRQALPVEPPAYQPSMIALNK
jgi:uncharacterized membrane protein